MVKNGILHDRVVVNALNKCPVYHIHSPIAQIHKSRNQVVEKEIVSLTIIHSDTLGKFLLPHPLILSSVGLEVLVPQWEVLLSGDTTNIPLKCNIRFLSGQIRFQILLS